jgi:hypothetical protein
VINLTPTEKLLFLYLLTNPLTNICGVYELPVRRIVFDTGIEEKDAMEILNKLEASGKVIYQNGWIGMKNWIRHQNLKNSKIRQGIHYELRSAPRDLVDKLGIDDSSIGLDESLHLNLNSNTNLNPNLKISLEEVFGNVKRIGGQIDK